MAKNGKTPSKTNGGETPAAGDNSKVIDKAINECASSMARIKRERKALTEEAGDIRQRIADLGIQKDSFDFAVKQQDKEPEARDNYLDGIRICFKALGLGDQSDMFPEVEQPEPGKPGFVQQSEEAPAA